MAFSHWNDVSSRPQRARAAPRSVGAWAWGIALCVALQAAAPVPVPADEVASTAVSPSEPEPGRPPADVVELRKWLEERTRTQSAMPLEARLAYRRGVIAWKGGNDARAVSLLRGAADLDPSYAAPHYTLASRFLTREPSQSLLSWAALLRRLHEDFPLQVELAGNALFYGVQALFFGLLAAALILVSLHQRELRHLWRERLGIVLSKRSAYLWSWAFLILPWFLGLGLATPALVMLAMLWPLLKVRERVMFMSLVILVSGAPVLPRFMGRLAIPLREDAAPLYGVQTLESAVYSADRTETLTRLAELHPESPFLEFGLGWVARRAGDVPRAEVAYRQVLERWPGNDRVQNNLGNLLAMQGRFDEALACYERAVSLNPRNAAAYFNSSQVHTRRFDYQAASDAVAHASALDFEMVQSYQARSGEDLPVVDQWIASSSFWAAIMEIPESDVRPAMPPAWHALMEFSGWPFDALALLLTVAGLVVGIAWQRKMPLRNCSNCGHPVCRRCAHRQREQALCPDCAAVAARAETPEFGRVLLLQRKRRVERTHTIGRTTLAALVPGLGLIASRRMLYALGLLMIGVLLVSSALGVRGPFALGQEFQDAEGAGWDAVVSWVLLYVLSLVGFLLRKTDPEPAVSRNPGSARSGSRAEALDPPARAA